MGTLVLFFDGVGLGRDDSGTNPFAAIGARRLGPVAGRAPDARCSAGALDATLGVPGLPQSATGQTTLLTGINAARHAGRHMVGLPGPTLRPLLERESLFLKLRQAGRTATFANAFSREHLEAARPRWSASTRAVMAAGLPFRMWDDAGLRGEALFHDYTGEWARLRGYDAPRLDARGAAEVLVRLVDGHDFVYYEYFLTDLVAHRGTWDERVEQALRAETLVDSVLVAADLGRHRVVVVSDHGNLEDGAHPRHTRNPVPLLVWGAGREPFARAVTAMTDLTPALVEAIDAA